MEGDEEDHLDCLLQVERGGQWSRLGCLDLESQKNLLGKGKG